MEAAEAKIQKVLEGSKQFLVPHYQRPYSWREDQWKTLWRDVTELLEETDPKPHFLGSIVSSPARSIPEGIEKRLLIDGQQRLTTLLVLLILIRDHAREKGALRVADRIQDLVTNRHEEGNDHYKLLPTQGEDPNDSDRDTFVRIVKGLTPVSREGIGAAYHFFDAKLRRADAPDIDALLRTIVGKLTIVSIILDEKDNPHRIFESLNGTGRPLSQADLIRNYFFMRIHEREHEHVYTDLWRPMQRRLGEESLTHFVRHYLTRAGQVIRETDVYAALKSLVDEDRTNGPVEHLKKLTKFSEYYAILLRPALAPTTKIRDRLERLNRLEVTVAYPFLLSVYADYARGAMSEANVVSVLDVLENYVVRRFVCGVPTYGLNKVFAPLYEQASRADLDFVRGMQRVLSASVRGYPRDEEFKSRLGSSRLYGGGERREKTKLILERMESALGHKETVPGAGLTIEHVMPQTLTDDWRRALGASVEEDHEELLHTLGNLTLTSYNPELSNSTFEAKKDLFAKSHVELNRYFSSVSQWNADEIERRAETLAETALSVWPYFGPVTTARPVDSTEGASVTGRVPRSLRMSGVETPVQSWVDVAVTTMEGIIAIGSEELAQVMAELPRFVNTDATTFRRSSRLRKLSNGSYMETNLSALHVSRLCLQATQIAGLGPDDWHVELAERDEDEEEGDVGNAKALSQTRQTQLQFWTRFREVLLGTREFTALAPPRAQHWFDLPLGRSGAAISLNANMVEAHVGVKLCLGMDGAAQLLEKLSMERPLIEDELGAALVWNPFPEKKTKTIKLIRPCNLNDESSWPEATAWLVQMALAFKRIFGPRLSEATAKPT